MHMATKFTTFVLSGAFSRSNDSLHLQALPHFYPYPLRLRTPPLSSLNKPNANPNQSLNSQRKLSPITPRLLPFSAYVLYMSHLFLTNPISPTPPLPLQQTLQTAINLSLNFIYILPLLFPHQAPTTHPILESIFNITVAWALLLIPLIINDTRAGNTRGDVRFWITGISFLTNVFYLPYLFTRRQSPQPTQKTHTKDSLSFLTNITQSRVYPASLAIIFIVSIIWGLFARPNYDISFHARLTELRNLVNTNILAHSFAVDAIVFSLFQGWLVDEDYERSCLEVGSERGTGKVDVWLGKLVPFWGLVWYLWKRPRDVAE